MSNVVCTNNEYDLIRLLSKQGFDVIMEVNHSGSSAEEHPYYLVGEAPHIVLKMPQSHYNYLIFSPVLEVLYLHVLILTFFRRFSQE